MDMTQWEQSLSVSTEESTGTIGANIWGGKT